MVAAEAHRYVTQPAGGQALVFVQDARQLPLINVAGLLLHGLRLIVAREQPSGSAGLSKRHAVATDPARWHRARERLTRGQRHGCCEVVTLCARPG